MGQCGRASLMIVVGLALMAGAMACSDDAGSSPDAAPCVPIDDDNECTADVCVGGAPTNDPVTPGTPCATGSCSAAGTCAPPTCSDGFENGTETDVDCGGSCLPNQPCDTGDGCMRATDCLSGVCTAMVCQAPRCGDGLMQPGEMCDDGNDNNGDGCDDGPGDACRPTGCGNGVPSAPEVCDDGNMANGDGCDNNCTPSACGNGVTAGAETCDDGNTTAGDGCSTACATEAGFMCSMAVPSVCTTMCGDGVRAGTETCDDGDAMGGDGCSAMCRVELGYTCTPVNPSVCTSMCGDGVVANNEMCDDAPPAEDGDGCSATCMVEAGFICMGTMPSTCVRRCGNGTIEAGEQCDDGNLMAGDGCSNACLFDLGCAAGQQQRVANATPMLAIPDNDPVGIASTVQVVGGAAVTRAAVQVTGITHTFVGDLDVALVSPGGVRRALSLRRGGGGANFRRTFFDDGAATAITTITPAMAPFSDRFRPEQSLSTQPGTDLLGVNAAGGWTLRVSDLAGQDEGTVDAWSLVMCVNAAAPFCGDGVRNGAEECDDANVVDNDACNNQCHVTAGCGDGDLDAGEACDDDNLTAGDGCSAVCAVDLTCPAGQLTRVVNNLGPAAIADNDPTGLARTVPIDAVGAVTKVAVTIDVIHTAAADLDVALIGPSGVVRELSTDNGGTGDHYAGTQLEDGAPTSVTTGAPPFTGRFSPEQSLTATAGVDFRASRAIGSWTLRVVDDAAGETGAFNRFTLAICIDPAAPFCGDGVTNGGEQCDDGNLIDNDTCSNLCRVRGCGDGILDVGEACDDGNVTAGDGCSPACAPDIACAGGQSAVIINQPASAAIPDTAAGLVSTVSVVTAGLVRRAIPIVNITHAADDQLDLFLESPRGVQRDLSSDQPGANYRGTVFSDAAATSIILAMAPYSGAFQPEQTISNPAGFGDQQAQGAWILRVSDDTTGTTGTLDSWSLALCVDTAAAARCGNGVVETGETCDDTNAFAGDGCSPTCQVELGCAGGQTAVVVSAADLPRLIPDNDPLGASSVVNVAAAGNVMKAVVVIGTVTHTFDGDLDLTLISPAATMVDLSSGNGGGDNDYVSTIFDDGAAASIITAVAPMRGRFSPEGMLSTLNAAPAAGAWTLKVVDHAGADTGLIVSWTLGLCVQ